METSEIKDFTDLPSGENSYQTGAIAPIEEQIDYEILSENKNLEYIDIDDDMIPDDTVAFEPKDDNFSNMRHWSYSKIDSEIQNCILLFLILPYKYYHHHNNNKI